MDPTTIKSYDRLAADLTLAYESTSPAFWQSVLPLFPKGASVLDIGCGSGRDVAMLHRYGFDCWGVDASKSMIDFAKAEHPELAKKLAVCSLPLDDKTFADQKFSVVSLVAVLMHVPDEQLFGVLFQMRRLVADKGLLLISCSSNRDGLNEEKRDVEGRIFIERHPEEYQILLERLGFKMVMDWNDRDSMGRSIDWFSQVYHFVGDKAARPVDQIESIISRDKKTATYKLALLRALADIAQTEYRQVKVVSKGRVGVPLGLLAERWVTYYWPLIASPQFIPQKRGEARGSKTRAVFRPFLEEVVREYSGNLSQFVHDFKSDSVPDALKVQADELIRTIAIKGIVKGPVKYSGEDDFFKYNNSSSQLAGERLSSAKLATESLGVITMPADVWREFCAIGYWIREAIVLRWAELCVEMDSNKGNVRKSTVLETLLEEPTHERDQSLRRIFAESGDLVCVWSGKSLSVDKFALDHLIPFAHWHNNELWNLLPASPQVNSSKSDQLPTSELLTRQKPEIIKYWTFLRSKFPERFDLELERSLVSTKITDTNWQDLAFRGFVEAIETLAIRKGLERWGWPSIPQARQTGS